MASLQTVLWSEPEGSESWKNPVQVCLPSFPSTGPDPLQWATTGKEVYLRPACLPGSYTGDFSGLSGWMWSLGMSRPDRAPLASALALLTVS